MAVDCEKKMPMLFNKEDKITSIMVRGINKFVKPYNEPAENIQVVFKLDNGGKLQYFTCINQQLKNTVTLEYLIGKNIYNMLVERHIKKLLQKFAGQHGLADDQVNLMAGVKAKDHVYVWLRNGNELIRQIEPDELK